MSDTYLNFMGKLIKLIDQNDGTYAFATELTPGAVNVGKVTLDEGNKYAGQVGVVLAKGVATVGGLNTLLDNTKNFPAALFAGKYLKVNIDGIEYVREILTNIGDGIAFRDIFAAVSAVNVYGEADGGQVTTLAPAGAEGDEYTIEFVALVQNRVETSASLADKRITVILGTGNNGVPASAVIGTGTHGTVYITHDNVGVAGNGYSVKVVEGEGLDVPMSVAFSDATKKIVVTLGTDAAGDLDALKNTALLIATEINIQVAGSEDPMTAMSSGDGSTALITAEAEKPLMGGIDPSIIATGADVAAAISTIQGFTSTMTGSGGVVAAGQGTFSGGLDAIVVPALAEYEIIDFASGTVEAPIDVQLSGSKESYIIPMFDLLAWSEFSNQPDGDDVEIVSNSASDTGKCTVFYTKKSDGTFAYATVDLTGVTAVALTGATDVDDVLGVFLGDIEGKNITPAVGTITLREASGDQAITTIVATKISKGMVVFDLSDKQIILNVHSGNVWKRCAGVVTATNGFKMNLTGGNIKEEKIDSMLYLISDTTGATAQIEVLA